MPRVLPIHTPAQSCSLAKVTVASVVLSLISASANDDTTESRANRCSCVVGTVRSAVAPSRQAHTAKTRNAMADAKAIGRAGSAAPTKWPIVTETPCARNAASATPGSTTHHW